jgi:L-rhamnose mutarotase
VVNPIKNAVAAMAAMYLINSAEYLAKHDEVWEAFKALVEDIKEQDASKREV